MVNGGFSAGINFGAGGQFRLPIKPDLAIDFIINLVAGTFSHPEAFIGHIKDISTANETTEISIDIHILSSLCDCEPPVTFNQPQPSDTDNLSKVPNRLQGECLSLAGNSTLVVSDKLIQRV